MKHASMHLAEYRVHPFCREAQNLQTWDAFANSVMERFADSGQLLAIRLKNRKQQSGSLCRPLLMI